MADLFGREEEENPFGNIGGDPFAGTGGDPFAGMGSDPFGPYKKNDPLATSWDNFKIGFGGGLQILDDIVGSDSFLSSWGESLEKSGEIGKEDYRPKYEGTFGEQQGFDKLGWAIERAKENAAGSGAILASAIIGAMVAPVAGAGGAAAAVSGAVLRKGIPVALAGFLNLDDVANTHVSKNNKPVSEYSPQEKLNLTFATAAVTALDWIVPGKIAKGFGGKPLNVRKSFEDIAKSLNNYEKMQFSNALMIGLKKSSAVALTEGGTEMAQDWVAELTSATHGKDITAMESLGTGLTGAVMGQGFGAIPGYQAATQKKREAKQGEKILDSENFRKLQQAGKDYGIQVTDYEKQYQDLMNSYEGPELETKLKEQGLEAGPKGKAVDVVPELYDFKRLDKSTFRKLTAQINTGLLRRSADLLQDIRQDIKTGKQFYEVDDTLRSFSDTQTGTGETQTKPSFNSLKGEYIGKFVEPFMDIRDKWAKHIPLLGEMRSRVSFDIDQYIGQSLEGKINKGLRQELSSRLGAQKMSELETDITKLKLIRGRMFDALKSRLGKDGLKIGFVKDYLTRGIDKKAVKADPNAFLKSLENDVEIQHTAETVKEYTTQEMAFKAAVELAQLEGNIPAGQVGHVYVSKKKVKRITETAEQVRQRILNDILNDVDPSTLTSEQIRKVRSRKGVDRPSFEKSRDGRWNRLAEQFRKKSPLDSMGDYLTNASIRLASSEAFGANNANRLNDNINGLLKSGTISNTQAQKIWDLYDASHHVYKRPQDDAGRTRQEAYKKIATAAAVKYLGMATVSSITEPMWIGQRAGWINMLKAAPRIAGYTLSGLRRSIYGGGEGREAKTSFARDLIRVMGFAINPKMNEKVDKMFAGDNNTLLSLYFRTPAGLFLTQYTNFVRAWTAVAGLKMIEGQAKKMKRLKGHAKSRLVNELKENGMTIQDFEAMYRAGGNKIDILNDKWLNTIITKSNGTRTDVRSMIVPWLRKIVTDVALEPTAVNRPLWMSNPDLQLLAQLKSFPILFGNTIARRVIRKINPKQCTPDFMGQMGALAAIGAALGMAALALAIKDEIRGTEREHGPIDLVGAIGVPLVGEASITGYMGGPALSIVDDFLSSVYGEGLVDTVGKTPEAILDIILRATAGTIGAEAFGDD